MSSLTSSIVSGMFDALYPLRRGFESLDDFLMLLEELGWELDLDDSLEDDNSLLGFAGDFMDILDAGEAFLAEIEQITDESSASAYIDMAEAGVELLQQVQEAIAFIRNLDNLDVSALPEVLRAEAIWQSLKEELPDHLLARYLADNQSKIYVGMRAFGFLEVCKVEADEDIGRAEYIRSIFRWEYLSDFVDDPALHLKEIYRWGGLAKPDDTGTTFNHPRLLQELVRVLGAMRQRADMTPIRTQIAEAFYDTPFVPAEFAYEVDIPFLRSFIDSADGNSSAYAELGLALVPVPSTPTGEVDGLYLTNLAEGGAEASIALSDDLTLTVSGDMDATGAFGVILRPDQAAKVQLPDGSVPPEFSAKMALKGAPQTPWRIFGSAAGPRLELNGFEVSVAGQGSVSDPELILTFATLANGASGGLTLKIEAGEGDSFIQELFSSIDLQADFDLEIIHSSKTGLRIGGSAGLEVTIPIEKDFGPIVLDEIILGLAGQDGGVRLNAGISGSAELGPVYVYLENIGLSLDISTSSQSSMGGLEFDAAFKPPTGIAVDLDASVIKGGGAIFNEGDEYRGALALQFANFDLSAFAILSTELPDGEKGYSFLASIFGTLNIQLGYGFVLKEVGGLVGIHRTTDTEALRSSLNAGNLDALLFPPEPIQDAALILDTMSSVFPARKGQYLFGPMAKITWMTPTIFQGSLGIIIEVGESERIVILGSVGATLPCDDAAIVVLQVDFAGVIDFDTGSIAFDAALANSRILTWPITGEFAMRTGWGQSAGLVASAGGLHPQYPKPAGFPSLQRMTINFGTNNPSLTLTAYTAMTLNSFQAGANASLYAKGPDIWLVGQFTVEGNAGFDTLIMINPFSFEAKLWLELKLLLDGDTVCGIGGNLKLSGPNSYYISGRVWVTVMGVDVSVSFSKRWGNKITDERQYDSAWDLLLQTVREQDGLETTASSHRNQGVTLVEAVDSNGKAVADPTGGLKYVQRAVPLGVQIEKLGNAYISDGLDSFDLEFSDVEGDSLKEDFVKGHFFALSDSEQLSGNAFVAYRCGLELDSADTYATNEDAARSFDHEYEMVLLGEEEEDQELGLSRFGPSMLGKSLRWNVGKNVSPNVLGYVESFWSNNQTTVQTTEEVVAVSEEIVSGKPRGKQTTSGRSRMVKNYLVETTV